MSNTNTQYNINFVKMLHLHMKKITELTLVFNSRISADLYHLPYPFLGFQILHIQYILRLNQKK